jgi:hypothetical protein
MPSGHGVDVMVGVRVAVGGGGVLVDVGVTGVGVAVAASPVIEPSVVAGAIGAPAGSANSTTPSVKLLTPTASIWKVMSQRGTSPWTPVVLAPTHLTTVEGSGGYAVLHNGDTLNRSFGSATQAVGWMTAGS